MLYIPNIDKYLKILTDEEVKDFVAINFSECFKFRKEKLYSKISKKQNLIKVTKSLDISLKTPDRVRSISSDNCIHLYNVEILNLFDPELQLKNAESAIKALLSKFKKFEVRMVIVLGYKKELIVNLPFMY